MSSSAIYRYERDAENGLEWTTPAYDDLGRTVSVTTPDSAVVTTAYSLATSGSQIGTTVTVTDQAGKLRRSITNALGQLTRVDEPNAAGQLGSVSSPNQYTAYSYDVLNNLTTVNQGVQTRTFTSNSLSKLISETNPESGTTSYEFDNNGNVTKKTDARGISANMTYDALNRIIEKSYSGESGYTTPTISYTYDEYSGAKGRLTTVSSLNSKSEYLSFDATGHVLESRQTTDGEVYDFQYTHNLAGMLVEQTYPSGRKARNLIDSNGDLSSVQSRRNENYGYWNYAHHFTYNAAGDVTSLQLGNGLWQSNQFNSRRQMTAVYLGSTPSTSNMLKLVYDFGTTQNNGDLLSQVITVPTVGVESGFTATQNYTYDSLNRLKAANETVNSAETWKQVFTFDRYGNRNFDEENTTTLPKSCMSGGDPIVCVALKP